MFRQFVALTLGALLSLSASGTSEESCRSLGSSDFGRLRDAPTRITAAAVVAAEAGVPQHCKVEGYVAPQVGFELRLPTKGWNRKLLTQGCGALCGMMLGSTACTEAVSRGYACVTTDMGHKGLPYDGKWAYNDPQAEIDFGHRATHVATVAAKAIVETYYGNAPAHAYFRGCSTGGRQALVAAQRYPFDFDGIIGGAIVPYQLMGPPLQLIWSSTVGLDPSGQPVFDTAKLPLLAGAVLQACDADDGLRDGIIDRPLQCRFDPASLACPARDAGNCLTAAEVEVARKMYSGPTTSRGERILPSGLLPGSEAVWDVYLKGGKASFNYGFASEILRYLAFPMDPGPEYEASGFDWDRDPQRMSLSTYTAANPDLTLFHKAGGKLLMFHGLADQAALATTTTAYYDLATRAMGGRGEMESFARLFLMPGMYHCRGGPGVNYADMLGALENWVERGEAPEMILGYHIADETRGPADPPIGFDPATASFSRPLYPYPDHAAYAGKGDWHDPKNFSRVREKEAGHP